MSAEPVSPADELPVITLRHICEWLDFAATVRPEHTSCDRCHVMSADDGVRVLRAQGRHVLEHWWHENGYEPFANRFGAIKRCEMHAAERLYPWLPRLDRERVRDWFQRKSDAAGGMSFVIDYDDLKASCL